MTVAERKTSFTISKCIKDIAATTTELLLPFIHTITADSEKEFAYHEQIAENLGEKIYFADPYS